MTQFTTPSITFELDTEIENSDIYATFEQKATKLTKKAADEVVEEGKTTFVIALTQAESAMFAEGYPVKVQVNWITSDGDRLASDIQEFPSFRNLLDEVKNYGD